jgi:amidase
MATLAWEDVAAEKRSRINKSIPSAWQIKSLPTELSVIDFPESCEILSGAELAITKMSATELVALLAQGKLKAVDVTLAFCKRAALAHQLVSSYHTQHMQESYNCSPGKLCARIFS